MYHNVAAGMEMKQEKKTENTKNVHPLLTDLKSCSSRRNIHWGRRIHLKAVESRDVTNMSVQTALIRMYGKCGRMADAQLVFDRIQKPNVVSWTALLSGYVENGDGLTSLELFSKMKSCGCVPDSVTYIVALKACTSLAGNRDGGGQSEWLKRGREIHSEIGRSMNIFVQSTLIDMYGKLGSMQDARRLFQSILKPNVVCWTTLLMGYTENGEAHITLELFLKMKACGCAANSVTYIAVLKACTSLAKKDGNGPGKWLEQGREIHLEVGSNLNIFVQNTLIDMYGKCGSMVDAHDVFHNITKPDVVSWTALLLGYVENGDGHAALKLFSRMKTAGCAPNSVTYIAALKACTSLAEKQEYGEKWEWLKQGREIHFEIGCNMDIFVQSTLVDMYVKCGSVVDAHRVFDSILKPDVVSWNTLLMGYAECGEGLVTLELFSRMKDFGFLPDSVTYIAALKACTSMSGKGEHGDWLKRGRQIHSEIGCHLDDIFVQNTLIDMYSNCGSIVDACCVFDNIRNPGVVSWNALLLGYAENGDGLASLDLFVKMKASGCAPDSLTYIAALKACGLIGALALGRKFHSEISDFTIHVVTCLVDFYAKCGSIAEACEVFNAHPREVSTWNALIAGYGSFGDTGSVFNLYDAMQDEGFQPNAVTFLCMLSSCSHAGLVEKARVCFDAMIMQCRFTPTVMHYNCMVDILGRANQLNEAVSMLKKMPCKPDTVTWMTLLSACRKWKNLEIGTCAFHSMVNIDKKNALAYVLMAQIYGNMGMWEEQNRMLKAKTENGALESEWEGFQQTMKA